MRPYLAWSRRQALITARAGCSGAVPGFVADGYQYRATPAGCTQAGAHARSKVGADRIEFWSHGTAGQPCERFTAALRSKSAMRHR